MSSSAAATGGGSTSMVSAEAMTGWHVFEVQGYSRYRTSGVGTVVTSGAFSVGGHRWRVHYFPCGYTGKENAAWVCFGLQLVPVPAAAADDDDDSYVKASFTLRLLDKDGAPLLSPYYKRISTLLDFSSTNNEWHCRQFIRSRDFDSLYLKADCFRIRCDLTVVLETRDEPVLPSPDLHRHLGNMMATGVGGDVTFKVGKEAFVAHKNVLAARSPVFMAQFFGGMMEKKQAAAHVRILGIHARAFKAMLHFIYTDSLPEIEEGDKTTMAQHLLVAADRYGIERLKLICENKLCISVDASVVATTLVLAEQHGCRRLKEACFKVLKYGDNFKALGFDDYNYLMQRCPSILDELLPEHGL